MKIKHIKIQNYRNLDGKEVYLHETINFIVGENNLGKSNFLNLLNILFSKRNGFEKEDFFDKNNPIEIEFALKLEDFEKGNFEDLIDAENTNQIRIKAVQESFEENLKFEHLDSGEKIMLTKIRNINYVHYDSLRNPITEISFDKVRGAGNFLNHLIKKKMKGSSLKDSDLIKSDNQDFTNLLSEVNATLQKIKFFKDHCITAKFETEIENLLTKLVLLKDTNERGLDKIGYGVQFSMLIALSILEKLVLISQDKNFQAFDYPVESPEKKAISLILGLDEPEIHLHPYMQRALVKYLVNITENKDTNFSEILKDVFDFDKVIGQVIIVTHSPNIVLNDYKQFIRFYLETNNLNVKSGNEITITDDKHIYKLFLQIKEAFFSRCIIVVEGDTEPASFPLFAKKMGFDFDELGITVLGVGGKNHIEKVMQILDNFGIANVGLRDLDDKNIFKEGNLYYTVRRDFEEEIVSIIDKNDGKKLLQQILAEHSKDIDEEHVQSGNFSKVNKTYKVGATDISGNIYYKDFESWDLPKQKVFFLSRFGSENFKNYTVSQTIGEILTIEYIPKIFKLVICRAIQKAQKQ